MGKSQSITFSDIFAIPTRNGLFRPTYTRGEGIKMINMGEIFAHGRIGDINMELVPLNSKEYEKFLVLKDDLLFARASLAAGAGKCCIFKGKEPTTFESHVIRVRIDNTIADPRFYYYFFNSRAGIQLMETIVEKTAASGIRAADLSNLRVPFPALDIQTAIGSFCETLDEKIENSNNMNLVLEGIARALFKSWFIDFDPVRAKAEGQQPFGMDEETAALFPSEFEDSELGEIPKGWDVIRLGEKVQISSGKRPNDVVLLRCNSYDYPVYGGAGIIGYSSNYLLDAPIILTGRVGTLGKFFLINEKCWPSDNTLVIRPMKNEDYEFIHSFLLNQNLSRLNRGSTQPLLTQSDLQILPMLYPTPSIVMVYHKTVKMLLNQLYENVVESSLLTSIRNGLLPKLISGDIRVDPSKFGFGPEEEKVEEV